ncbi:MAG: heavy metal translocating P-type ATPase [Candidatus Bathyarchaeia archaeon]
MGKHGGHAGDRLRLSLIALSGALMVTGFLHRHFMEHSLFSSLLLLTAMIAAGIRIAFEGVRGLLHARVDINLLVTIAAVGAAAIGHLDEGAAILVLFNIAEYLEEYAGERARRSIELMMELRPEVAVVRRGGLEEEVRVEEVEVGETILIRPGDRIPLDGVVGEGSSSVNEAPITGESVPVFKGVEDEVYAGTINNEGFLVVRVTKRVEETLLSKIVGLILEADLRRSPTERFIDRFSRYYTPAIILLAAAVAVIPPFLLQLPGESWVYRSLIFLVLSCPCALAISTPIAMVSAITSSARNGVLIKGSAHVEEVKKARVFAFDKTGTLTQGELSVTDVLPLELSEQEILERAASLEEKSKHPIGKAIVEAAQAKGLDPLPVEDFSAYIGRGIRASIGGKEYNLGNLRLFKELGIEVEEEVVKGLEAEGKTTVLLGCEGRAVGAIALMDKLREGADEAVSRLRELGVKVVMMTGDNGTVAQAIAGKLGIEEYYVDLLPEEKVELVERLSREHGHVAMVGDGVNDAPALAGAGVGIAMGAVGSDVALETADVALMNDNLNALPYLLQLSRRTLRRIKENVAASVLVKAICGVLVFPQIMTLWLAVMVGDLGLTLAVILNSLRLSRLKVD